PRGDFELGNLRDRCGLLEIRQEPGRLIDQSAVVAMCPFGQALEGPFPRGIVALVLEGKAAPQHRVDDLSQGPIRDRMMAVSIRNHLALLGDSQAAIDGTVRLGKDGTVGWSTSPTDGSAA